MVEYKHMSLQEKLSRFAKNLQETKAETERQDLEGQLEPIRAKIEELENEKYKLELVRNSLGLHSGEKVGKGMREYSEDINEQVKKESTNLDTLVDKNREVLQAMGIESKDQLVEDEEFSKESEIVNYKKAKGESADLVVADDSLKEKLKTLGVSIDENNFSYDSVESALAERLQSLEQEILQEKLKTPEGKESVVETLSKDLEGVIPQMSVSKDDENAIQSFDLAQGRGKITTLGEVRFEGWDRVKLLPEEMAALEETYGEEVVKAALLKAYDNKVGLAFESFDKDTNNLNKILKEDLERSSPEKAIEANNAFREFQNLAGVLRTTLEEKAQELKAKGIHFSPDRIQNYGGNYKTYGMLCEHARDNELVKDTMDHPSAYPPKLNFDALKEYTEKRIEQIKELIEDIKRLETEEDINMFTKGERGGISKAYRSILETEFDGVKRSQYDPRAQSQEQAKARDLTQFKSYQEASDYLNEKDAERQSIKGKILQSIGTAIDTDLKGQELSEEIVAQNFGKNLNDVEWEISHLEKNKKDALALMSELVKLESELPNEQVTLDGNEIRVLSVGERSVQLGKDREAF
jgi:hypothetical protein